MKMVRVSVVLMAFVAVCPVLGNAAEIMMNRDECDGQCSILDAPQYSDVTGGARIPPKNLDEPSTLDESDEEDNNSETKNREMVPAMLIFPASGGSKNHARERPMILVRRVKEDSNSETKNQQSEPTMLVVPATEGGRESDAKSQDSEQAIMVVPTGRENKDEKKDEETQPTMLLMPAEDSCSGKKLVTGEPMLFVPAPIEGNCHKKTAATEPTMILMQSPIEDDKENEIENDDEDKDEDKAEEEDSSMEVCQRTDNEKPEMLKNNHHIKKDLKCKINNSGLEEDVQIGVIKSGKSVEVEDHVPRYRRQNWKQAADNKKLALQYVALLDKAVEGLYPLTKTPTFDINEQYNPWNQYTLSPVLHGQTTSDPFQSFNVYNLPNSIV